MNLIHSGLNQLRSGFWFYHIRYLCLYVAISVCMYVVISVCMYIVISVCLYVVISVPVRRDIKMHLCFFHFHRRTSHILFWENSAWLLISGVLRHL